MARPIEARAGLTALVLGSAAGGGFPQWNCGCALCALARAGDSRVAPRTQASVALTADRQSWLLIGASPDLRQQIMANPALQPSGPGRSSPIRGVVLLSAEIDGIAGLLTLREQQTFAIYAPRPILQCLADNPIFRVLDPALVERVEIAPLQPARCAGLTFTLLPMPGKVPLYLESNPAELADSDVTYAAIVESVGRRVIIAPGCAAITEPVAAWLRRAHVVFFDGTLFTDDEMIRAGLGAKTGRRMGHVPVDGPDGSLAVLAKLPGRRIYFHINNSNPMLLQTSPECAHVMQAGIEIAHDGMEVRV